MAEIDALMMKRIGVNTFQLMELAGYAIADAARQRADMHEPRSVLALAGTPAIADDSLEAGVAEIERLSFILLTAGK